jgi:hypothetical protein
VCALARLKPLSSPLLRASDRKSIMTIKAKCHCGKIEIAVDVLPDYLGHCVFYL